jgi:hypothetical protein
MSAPRPTALNAAAAQIRPVTPADERVLPVPPAIAPLLPNVGLRRGSTVVVANSAGLLLALLGPPSAAGAHLGLVNRPDLGMLAAAEAGVELSRCYVVSSPPARWAQVVAILLEAVDVVVVQPPRKLGPSVARRLSARAQAADSLLVVTGSWPGAEVVLAVAASHWYGLETDGHGYLRARRAKVVVTGRRAAGRGRQAWVWLPDRTGQVVEATAGSGAPFS